MYIIVIELSAYRPVSKCIINDCMLNFNLQRVTASFLYQSTFQILILFHKVKFIHADDLVEFCSNAIHVVLFEWINQCSFDCTACTFNPRKTIIVKLSYLPVDQTFSNVM